MMLIEQLKNKMSERNVKYYLNIFLKIHEQFKIILLGIISIVCIARTSGKTDGTENHVDETKRPLLSAKRASVVPGNRDLTGVIDDRSSLPKWGVGGRGRILSGFR